MKTVRLNRFSIAYLWSTKNLGRKILICRAMNQIKSKLSLNKTQ